jgi:crotonobetainyl-CoA:carnitine CoA-transferase CaiB-like acyl-CoA transferase
VTGPLQGVRVVDMTAMLAGPYSTMLLADLGADVVKIEAPRGDVSRRVEPFRPGDTDEGLSGYFHTVNRGKRSVVLDLKQADDHERLLALVREADVIVENFSPGVMDRLGLSYERLIEENPRLVYGAVRGFGDERTGDSPYREWPAYDVVAQAMSGFLSITGTVEGMPIKSGPGIGDIVPGVFLALGIVSAVVHARRTGEGQFVDVAMYDAMLAITERIVYQHSYTGEVPKPHGNGHPLLSPFDIFATADGWIAVAAPADQYWAILAAEIGRPELATDERYTTNAARARHGDDVRGFLAPWLAGQTTAELVKRLGGRVPIGPVNDVAAIYADPHVAARGMLVEVEQPGSDIPVTLAGSPIKYTKTPAGPAGRGPLLGEHRAEDVLEQWNADVRAGEPA